MIQLSTLEILVQTTFPNYPQAIRAKEAAAMLCCSVTHIYNLVKSGHLQRTQIGARCYVYDPLEVLLLSIRGIPASYSNQASLNAIKQNFFLEIGRKLEKMALSLKP